MTTFGEAQVQSSAAAAKVGPFSAESSRVISDDEAYLKSLPRGYKFSPTDEDLVDYYLRKKLMNECLPPNKIKEVELYQSNPAVLAANHNTYEDGEWYFFTRRYKKYKNSSKNPDRTVSDGGFWKATGKDMVVKKKGQVIGHKKALAYYDGRVPKGKKTDWLMHEYTLDSTTHQNRTDDNNTKLDVWVLCRIYKTTRGLKTRLRKEYPSQNELTVVPPLPGTISIEIDKDPVLEASLREPIRDSTSLMVSNKYHNRHSLSLLNESHNPQSYVFSNVNVPLVTLPNQSHNAQSSIFTNDNIRSVMQPNQYHNAESYIFPNFSMPLITQSNQSHNGQSSSCVNVERNAYIGNESRELLNTNSVESRSQHQLLEHPSKVSTEINITNMSNGAYMEPNRTTMELQDCMYVDDFIEDLGELTRDLKKDKPFDFLL